MNAPQPSRYVASQGDIEKDLVHLGGDQGVVSNFAGSKATAQFTLEYKGRWRGEMAAKQITCELYATPEGCMVTTSCVRCHNAQTIQSENKKISYEPGRGLFIESFTCTWELEGDRRIHYGNVCSARVAYDGKVIKDAG